MSIRDSLKEALKDPAVVQILTNAVRTNAITSSLRGEIHTLREALERKKEKSVELQDRDIDSLEQYSRRNNVQISGIPESTSAVVNTDAIVQKVGEAIGVTDDLWRDDWSVTPGRQAGKDMSSSSLHLTSISTSSLRARSGLKNKDAACLGLSPAGAVKQLESAAAAAAMLVPSPAGRVYVNDDLTRERSRVAARVRQLKRDKKIKDTWVRDREIYEKMNDDYINKLSTSRQLVFG